MAIEPLTIEIDETTSVVLKERAAERGMTVSELISELVDDKSAAADVGAEQIAELDRRWAAHQSKRAATSHGKVVRWLDSWGTPAFQPWRDQ
jgi:hypothetical protein